MMENDLDDTAPVIGAGDTGQLDSERLSNIYPERRTLDRLLVPLAARCMKAPIEQIDGEIEKGLKDVLDIFYGDRALLWEIAEDGHQAILTHYYAESGFEPPDKAHLHETLPYMFDRILGLQNICVSGIDDLPASAKTDRQYLDRSGVRSFMIIPLLVGNLPRGALSLACIRAERTWTNADLFHFQRVGIVLASALDRKRSHIQIDQRMRFEAMLADLSAGIIKSQLNEVDSKIERGLARVSEFFRADRCGLLSIDIDHKSVHVSHAYYAEGVARVSPDVEIASLFPWCFEEIVTRKRPINVTATQMAALPPEAETDRRSWAAMGVRSNLTIPLFTGETLEHVIVIHSMNEERVWPEEYVPRLRLLGELFVNALKRKRAETLLCENEARLNSAVDVAALGFYEEKMTSDGRSTFLDGRMRAYLGIPPEQEHRTHDYWVEHLHSGDRQRVLDLSQAFETQRQDYFVGEYRYQHEQHGVLWFHHGARAMERDASGRLVRLVGVIKDITEQKKSEEDLKKSYAEIARLKDRLEAENTYLRKEISTYGERETIIGQSDSIKYVHYRINQVASLDSTVLIVGETGTGKGLVARAVHERSLRKDRPMIHVNCAVLPANLIESELFGREKGAFTGAQAKQIGRFELAHNGTIFLDEIAELPVELQAKFLRVVEDGKFERLGSPHSVKVDVRIIASTNRNLQEEIQKGRFREDLFYRLNVFPITVPPLHQRTEDIPMIVEALIERMNKQLGRQISKVPQEVMRELQSYSWPGNVRELENVIERAVIMTRGQVLQLTEQLGAVSAPKQVIQETSPGGLADVERFHIRKTLEALKWKIEGPNGSANALGLKPSTLRTRMQKLNIRRPPKFP